MISNLNRYPNLKNCLVFFRQIHWLKTEISGHTDNVGSYEDNVILSENRAKAVVNYLISHGIESSRLTFKGYADKLPIDTNDTPEGRARNRRTEFKIIGN